MKRCIIYRLLAGAGVFLLFLQSPISFAYTEKEAINNVAHEFAICGAFYLISADALRQKEKLRNMNSDLSNTYARGAEHFIAASSELSSKEVTVARVQMALKEMMGDVKSDYGNISIIMNKYIDGCKNLAENPDQRMKYWLEKSN